MLQSGYNDRITSIDFDEDKTYTNLGLNWVEQFQNIYNKAPETPDFSRVVVDGVVDYRQECYLYKNSRVFSTRLFPL